MKKLIILLAVIFLGVSVVNASPVNNDKDSKKAGTTTATSTIKATSTKDRSDKATPTNPVSVEAKDIRGWSEQEKSDFLQTVKTHAQLQSGNDLENFAKGVLVRDENVDSVTADDDSVEVDYKLPAKFLGIFKTQISAMTDVSFDTDKSGNGPKEVTVKFPWYRMFYSLDQSVQEDILKNTISSTIEADVSSTTSTSTKDISVRNAKTIQLISALLKNIRASIEAVSTLSVE